MNTNKVRRLVLALSAIAALGAVACDNKTEVKPPASPVPASSASPAASPAASPSGSPAATNVNPKVESMVGRWSGSDAASSLNITKKADKFSIEITGAGGPKTFEGTAKGDAIEFTRDGKVETLKASTGAETGVKALEKEANCVVVTKGKEAYCRK